MKTHAVKRNYELMLILDRDKTDEKRTELLNAVKKMAGSGVSVEKMGLRRFSVPINYKPEGYYQLLHFEADKTRVAEMTKAMNITDGIVRFMFVSKTDKQIEADKVRKAAREKMKAEREAAEKEAKKEAEEKKPVKRTSETKTEKKEVEKEVKAKVEKKEVKSE